MGYVNLITRGAASVGRLVTKAVDAGGLTLGGGTAIDGLTIGTVSVNPASLATVTKAGTEVTITGVATGDIVLFQPPSDLEAGLLYVGCAVTGANKATVYLYNPTGEAVDGAAKNWTYIWISKA